MKRRLTVELLNIKGEPFQTEPTTIRDACVMALSADYRDENLKGDEKYKRYKLMRRIEGSEEVELAAEDLAMLKLVVAKCWPPLVVGQVYDLLDSDPG